MRPLNERRKDMMTTRSSPAVADLAAARARIAPVVLRTPLVRSDALSELLLADVRLKVETLQPTGSFKIRGATNAVERLRAEGVSAVVCVSTGNHGRAVAFAARRAGMTAIVCLSRLVPENKVAALKALGADVRVLGASQDEAQGEVDRLVAAGEAVEVSPFDHPDVIAGQGTIGLEILEEFPKVDTVVVPASGGGLIGGIALAVKAARPDVRIIGVSMARGAALHASLRAGHPVPVTEEPTLADCLGGGIGLDNRYTLSLARDLVERIVLIDEDRIAEAMRFLFTYQGLVVEGGGAIEDPGRHVVVVVSGRNVDPVQFRRVLDGGTA